MTAILSMTKRWTCTITVLVSAWGGTANRLPSVSTNVRPRRRRTSCTGTRRSKAVPEGGCLGITLGLMSITAVFRAEESVRHRQCRRGEALAAKVVGPPLVALRPGLVRLAHLALQIRRVATPRQATRTARFAEFATRAKYNSRQNHSWNSCSIDTGCRCCLLARAASRGRTV